MPKVRATESAKANAFFNRVFDEDVARNPIQQGYLGIKRDQDKWYDYSEAFQLENLQRTVQHLGELKRTIRYDLLDEQTQVSYRMFELQAEHAIEGWRWRRHRYLFTQMGGMHADAPAFLINFHAVDNVEDARAYITRLQTMRQMFAQLQERAEDQARHGILPPKFVFPLLIESSREVISGAPFDSSGKP